MQITNSSEEIEAVGISIATTLIEGLTDDAIENGEVELTSTTNKHNYASYNTFTVYADQGKLLDYN